MDDVSIGTVGRVMTGAFAGMAATVRGVTRGRLKVEVLIFGRKTEVEVQREEFLAQGAQKPPSVACPYQPGDTVLRHEGTRAGATGVVTEVDEARAQLLFTHDDTVDGAGFLHVTLVHPPRRDVLPDYLAVIEATHPLMGYNARRFYWWAEQLGRGGWDSDEALLRLAEEHEAFERELQAEQDAALRRKQRDFSEAYAPLSFAQRVARWRQEFQQWVGWRPFMRQLGPRMDRQLLGLGEAEALDEDALRERANARLEEGRQLRQRVERAKRRKELRKRCAAWRAEVLPDADSLARERRRAREEVRASAERVRARLQRSHGITLPDHVFEFQAFWNGLHPVEREAAYSLDLVPMGLLDLFDDTVEQRRIDGLDLRLHGRYYRDPPEFFTVLHGGTDGLHYGLWYDDPSAPPAFIASYYNNDGGELGLFPGALLDMVREQLGRRMEELEDEEPGEGDDAWLQLEVLREALDAFAPSAKPVPALPGHRLDTVDGAGALVRPEDPEHARDPEQLYQELSRIEPEALRERVAAALASCEAGDPSEALALGRDLHWLSHGVHEREEAAAAVLEAAYRALGRTALAEVARVHQRHRDLRTVGVIAGT
jgi:hypothetical protein